MFCWTFIPSKPCFIVSYEVYRQVNTKYGSLNLKKKIIIKVKSHSGKWVLLVLNLKLAMPKFISQYIPNWDTSKFSFLPMLSSVYYVQNHPTDIRTKNIQILKYPVLELLRFAELRKHKINKLLGWEQAYRYQAFATWKRIIHRHQNIACPRTLCAVGQLSPMTYCCSWYQSHKMFFFFLEKSEKEYFKGKPLLCFQTLIWVKERAANFSFPKSLRDRPLVILN